MLSTAIIIWEKWDFGKELQRTYKLSVNAVHKTVRSRWEGMEEPLLKMTEILK
jgi:hypothetical protein